MATKDDRMSSVRFYSLSVLVLTLLVLSTSLLPGSALASRREPVRALLEQGSCAAPYANEIVGENCLPATRPASGTSRARATPASRASPPTSASTGWHRHLQGRYHRDQLSARHLPPGLLRRPRRAQGRDGAAHGGAAADPAGLPHRRGHGSDRLRQLGRLGVLGGARPTRPPASTSPSSCARTQRWREPHRLHRARR